MNVMLEFAPLIPVPLLLIAAAISALIASLTLWQNRRGALLRALALGCLILALANPNLRQEERKTLSNIAIVVVDETASQALAGRTERTKGLKKDLEQKLKNIPNLEVRWITSTNKSEEGTEGTTLFSDLNRGLSGVPADRLAGVIMITDGEIHDVPVSAKDVTANAPIHALITGQKQEFDRRVEIVRAPRFGLVDTSDTVKFRIVESSKEAAASEPVRVKITREGLPVEERIVQIGQTEEFEISFPHAGENIAEIELLPSDGELTLANNRAVISAEGVRENLRVLLVSGEPHAGERTWRNLLKSDAAVDLVHFTILRPPEKQDGTPINQLSLIAFPTRELFSEKLDEFDLIIFDRYQRRNVLPLLYLDNIARYVESGGAVLVAAGESFSTMASLYRTPLAQVLPAAPTGNIIEQPYRALMTKDGIKHPVTAALPGGDNQKPSWGKWFRLVEANYSQGQILMKGPKERPLLILDRIRKGRVALLLSDHAWLWARGYDGGGPYTSLLRRTAHWLMKEPDLEEEFLRAKGRGKNLNIERRSMSEKIDTVQVTSPSGKTTTVTLDDKVPGIWSKKVKAEEPGLYRLKSGDLEAFAHVGPINSKEVAKVTATNEPLEKVQEQTGGGAFWMGKETGSEAVRDLPRLSMLSGGRVMHGSDWLALRDRDAHLVQGIKLTPLFTGLIALAILLGFVSVTWFREGR